MKNIVNDLRLIYKCCVMYYEQGLSQQQIADRMDISRVSVSRMLQAGKESGIVQIQVFSPNHLNYGEIEQQLEKKLGLKEVVVVESSPLATAYDQMSALGSAAVNLIENYIHNGDIIGVSMGYTLHNVCRTKRMNQEAIRCTFVPVLDGIRSISSTITDVHSNQIAIGLAQLYGGDYIEFFSPAMFSNIEILRGFMAERSMREVLDSYERMSTVIMGIGTPKRSSPTMMNAGYITQNQTDFYVKRGAVGDLAMQFFDINGRTEPFNDFNRRVAGLQLADIRKIRNKICIASGRDKAEAVYGAVKGEFVNIIVVDEECAEALMSIQEEKNE